MKCKSCGAETINDICEYCGSEMPSYRQNLEYNQLLIYEIEKEIRRVQNEIIKNDIMMRNCEIKNKLNYLQSGLILAQECPKPMYVEKNFINDELRERNNKKNIIRKILSKFKK